MKFFFHFFGIFSLFHVILQNFKNHSVFSSLIHLIIFGLIPSGLNAFHNLILCNPFFSSSSSRSSSSTRYSILFSTPLISFFPFPSLSLFWCRKLYYCYRVVGLVLLWIFTSAFLTYTFTSIYSSIFVLLYIFHAFFKFALTSFVFGLFSYFHRSLLLSYILHLFK